MVAHEIDGGRRELRATKNDAHFYQVRDDQLFSNLGVLLKINKQPFFTKKTSFTTFIDITIEEDKDSRPKCLTENLARVKAVWQTELDTTTQVEYSLRSPYIIPGTPDPITQLSDPINEDQLRILSGNPGKTHSVTIPGLKFDSEVWFRVINVNQVGERRQSEFIHLKIPAYPLIAPVVSKQETLIQDAAGRTLQVPFQEDPFGLRQYRKVLYGVLKSYLTGPTPAGITFGIQPFFDLPVQVTENFPAIPDLYETLAIRPEDEILVHTFNVDVIVTDINRFRSIGELNPQVLEVLDYIKPAHTLPALRYVMPEHFFCPEDNPFGVKQKRIELEPTAGPCGEKVYINPTEIDLGSEGYYEDVLGYNIYCNRTINYFQLYCPLAPYGQYEVTNSMFAYFQLIGRNYFLIDHGKRLLPCPFVKNRDVVLLLEHRNGTDPISIRIEGDVSPGPNTFKDIPYEKIINVRLTQDNGPKTVLVTFTYLEQLKTTNATRLTNESVLAPGCHGGVTVQGVTFLLNTIPGDCCVEEYIEDSVAMHGEVSVEEVGVFTDSFSLTTNNDESVINGPHGLGSGSIDEINREPFNADIALMTNVSSRTLNDPDLALSGMPCSIPADIEIEQVVQDCFKNDVLYLNFLGDDCRNESRLNCSMIICAEKEFYMNGGSVIAEVYHDDQAFITNGVQAYRGDERFYPESLTNGSVAVMSPIDIFDLEPWNTRMYDTPCELLTHIEDLPRPEALEEQEGELESV